MPDLRLIKSDVLKLRRRRGMLAVCAGLTLGILLLAFTVITIQHGGDPVKNDPAGGLAGFNDSLQIVSLMVFLVGAIVGATAGAQDLDSGVFRDLAATGRSRTALFLSRVCGAWVVVGALAVLTIAVDVAGAFVLADGTPTPHVGDVVDALAMVLASGAVGAALAVGLAALVGSRGPVIAILLAFHLVFEPQLQGAGFLGDARQALPISAINRIGDQAGDLDYTLALGTSIAVVARLDRGRAGRRRMAHEDARDLVRRGRGYAPRVSRPFRRGCASRRPARGDIGLTLLVVVLVLPGTVAAADRATRSCWRRCSRSPRRCRCWSAGAGRSWCSA